MLRVMHRSVWLAFAAVLAIGLLGGLLLSRALHTTSSKPKPSLAPTGARVLEDQPLRGTVDQRVVTWRIGGHAEELASGLYGVTIWQGEQRLYTHRARIGAGGIYVETGDFTSDGNDDVLVFEDQDGSGGCGVYRALTTRRSVRHTGSSAWTRVDPLTPSSGWRGSGLDSSPQARKRWTW